MSEGKKTLVVVEDLDRLLLRGQLDGMGLDIEVVVDNNQTGVMGSMIMGLLSNPATKEEALTVLAKRDYSGDYRADASLLLEKVAKEFNEFCVFHKFQALRDSTIGKLNYAFSQGPDSGGNPALQDEQLPAFASIKGLEQVMPNLMMEMLKELKGIKEAVTPTTVKIDTAEEPEKSAFCIHDWLNFAMKNQDEIKDHVAKFGPVTYEGKPVTSKAGAIAELTNILKWESGGLNLLPSVLLFSLSAKDREEIIRLLHPKVSFVVGSGNESPVALGGPDAIIDVLLSSLREEIPSDVHFHGLSVLRTQEREILIDKLEGVIGKRSVKVAGQTKETFVDGLSRALTQALPPNTDIVIQGIDQLDKESTRDLFNLLNIDNDGTSTSIWKQTNTRVAIEKLVDAVGGNEVGSVTLHDLKLLDSRVKRNLHAALKTALEKYDELEARDKKLYVAGEEHLPKEVTGGNTAYTLGILTNLWTQAAHEKGIELDQMSLLDHLLKQVGTAYEVTLGDEPAPRIFARGKQGSTNLTNITGVDIVIGNHSFARNEDGSLKITTEGVNGSGVSTFVLAIDGSIKLNNPGYMG